MLNKFTDINRWKNSFSFERFLNQSLQGVILAWVVTEPFLFLVPQSTNYIQIFRYLFVLSAIIRGVYSIRPRDKYSYEIKGREVDVEIVVGDAFDIEGSLVVPVNDLFKADIKGRMLQAESLQGKLLRNFYYRDTNNFQKDLDRQNKHIPDIENNEIVPIEIHGETYYKYPIGTILQLEKDNKHFYLLANTQITTDGVASSTEQELITSLECLWKYIAEKGKQSPIVLPLIGSQHGRLPLERERVVQHIVHTFITSCEHKSYCRKLTIVIYPPDLKKKNTPMNLKVLDEMLSAMAKFPYFRNNP